jgi:hypothetical protein
MDNRFIDWWLRWRKEVHKDHGRGFDSFVALVAWSLWRERNARVFDGIRRSVQDLIHSIKDVAASWVAAEIVNSCELFS